MDSRPAPPPVHARLAAEIRHGVRAALEVRFDSPPKSARLHRFLHGFALPFAVLRALLRDPAARRTYLRTLAFELPFVFLVAFVALSESDKIVGLFQGGGVRKELDDALTLLATIAAQLSVGEWCVVALAHEHHDALGATAAELTGAPDEPLPGPPRVRLDLPWLWLKLKRKARDFLFMACGAPLFCLVLLLPSFGDEIFEGFLLAWAGYWAAVFALGNTYLAWDGPDAFEPWFLRLPAVIAPLPLLGIPARLYLRLARRITRGVHPACATFEEAPFEAAGLAAARLVCGVPFVYLAMRPVFGVAATHALVGRREMDGLGARDEAPVALGLPEPSPSSTRPASQ